MPTVRRFAVLGATSHLARDLIAALSGDPRAEMTLFARDPPQVQRWTEALGLTDRFPVLGYQAFADRPYDAIINFVGAGDPARLARLGADIRQVTAGFDRMALAYLRRRPDCRYFFLSSGAVHGGAFDHPANAAHAPSDQDGRWRDHYATAKLEAELRHRALPHLPIVDLRVFSYFSRTLDLSTRFFMADLCRALRDKRPFVTPDRPMARDYLHPADFAALIRCLLDSQPVNAAIDVYSAAPAQKHDLLAALRNRFGLDFCLVSSSAAGIATERRNYYSLDRTAATFGYRPAFCSLAGVLEEAAGLITPGP